MRPDRGVFAFRAFRVSGLTERKAHDEAQAM